MMPIGGHFSISIHSIAPSPQKLSTSLNDAFAIVEVVSPLERNFKRDAASARRPVLFGSGPRRASERWLPALLRHAALATFSSGTACSMARI